MVDDCSTFFVIRGPNVELGDDSRMTSVQRLTAEYFSDREGALGPDHFTVAIDAMETGRGVVCPIPDIESGAEGQ